MKNFITYKFRLLKNANLFSIIQLGWANKFFLLRPQEVKFVDQQPLNDQRCAFFSDP